MTEEQRKALAYLLGLVGAVHKELAAYGDELDGARCSLEDAYGVMTEALTGESGPEALARVL